MQNLDVICDLRDSHPNPVHIHAEMAARLCSIFTSGVTSAMQNLNLEVMDVIYMYVKFMSNIRRARRALSRHACQGKYK